MVEGTPVEHSKGTRFNGAGRTEVRGLRTEVGGKKTGGPCIASKHFFLNPFIEKDVVKHDLFSINVYDVLFLEQSYRLLY